MSVQHRGAGESERIAAWRSGGGLVVVGAHRIFVRRQGGEGPLLVLLHGFPSSSFDWRSTVAELPGRAWTALDFLGFGLSDKPPLANSLMRQAGIVEAVVAAAGRPVVIAAHDMGTSVTTELLARDLEGRLSFELAGVLLFNGSVIIERASLTWAQRLLLSRFGGLFARFGSARLFKDQFGRLFSAGHPLRGEEADDQWELWSRAGGHRLAHLLINYVRERTTHAERWHGAVRDWPGELRLAWGLRDPVATVEVLRGLRELRPGAPVTELPELGHYPQIEQPQVIAGLIAELLAAVAAG